MPSRAALFSVAAMALFAWAPRGAHATATVDVLWVSGSQSTVVTSSATLTALIYITPGPEGLATYRVSLQWDPTQLQPLASDCVAPNCEQSGLLEEYLPGGFLFNFDVGISELDSAAGEALTWEAVSFGPGVFGSFVAGFIAFHATPTGQSEVVPGFHNTGTDGMQAGDLNFTDAEFYAAVLNSATGTTTSTTTTSTTTTTTSTTTTSTTTTIPTKVTICHVSEPEKSDPGGMKTIRVSTSSMEGHLQHGDSLGACP